MIIRNATLEDIPYITDIYNEAVENGTAIWDEVVVGVDNRTEWWRKRTGEGFPMFVVEDDDANSPTHGEVVGYATYGRFRPYQGYRYSVEHSIYIRSDQRGKGIAVPLMEKLIDRAREGGQHVMVAAIEASNKPSIGLHEKLGFEHVGHMKEVGIKFGEWLDLVLMQLKLNDDPAPGAKQSDERHAVPQRDEAAE
ncbi:GNAT family N-acetyltransferase [Corynebacterium sp. zg254]|uniref:N-acetyltransferase n=1 Tax=Corynebacterium zhongnanshanii TaxID=2768834 RepID=A0ABQ6VCN5_9CORY|nr:MULTISPECIES: GNAT family N-acetyltransferase [Corynebacterium]KAB3519248.1 N-acetyltransferase [Corynebacterium zhongnanshanii]MCR5915099.1 GNAT family N-acetyltransferase [Corynebacterium sp. zg254]